MDYQLDLSFHEFIDRCRKPGRKGPGQTYWSECKQHADGVSSDFFLTPDFAAALKLLESGWPEGATRLKTSQVRGNPSGESFSFTPRFDVCGSEVDVGRYLSGEHECMIDYHMERTRSVGRVVPILINHSLSSGVGTKEFTDRGLMILGLVDSLESAGYRCEIVILSNWNCQGKEISFRIAVKEADQPIDLDRMAFLLMHSDVVRRFIFRLQEQMPDALFRIFYATAGMPCDFKGEIPEGAIVVPKMLLGKSEQELDQFKRDILAQYLEPEVHAA